MAVEISLDRRDFLANAVMAIGGAWIGISGRLTAESPVAIRLSSEGEFPPLSNATAWLNSQPDPPRTLAALPSSLQDPRYAQPRPEQ